MNIILPCACGVDVHEEMIEVCILTEDNNKIIPCRKQFSTMPDQLIEFTNWLFQHNCFHIAMESTGVYWKPVYEAIEKHSPYYENIIIGNAHHMKNVPGRKSDIKDAEWIATLCLHGLINNSFVPNQTIRNLRETARTYKKFVGENSRYKNRIEKFLQAHGFKLSGVLKDIFCVTGRNIICSLALRGSLTLEDISSCMRGNCKSTADEIFAAMNVSISPLECELLQTLIDRLVQSEKDLKSIVDLMLKIASPYKRQLEILDSIPGIDIVSALLILAEIGDDPVKNFQTSEKLCSWAGLIPRNDKSAGKIYARQILPGNQHLKPVLTQVAWVAVRMRNTPFNKWFWSRRKKLGEKTAIIAVCRKILRLIFFLLANDTLYDKDIAMANINK